MINYICSPIWYYELLRPVYLPLMAALSILCGFLNCLAQTIYKRPYPIDKRILQFSPSIIALLFTNFPVFLHYFSADKDYELNYDIHFLSYGLFAFGSSCFAFDVPQRFYPGKMDFIGQGHHLFHICIFVVSLLQLNAAYDDYTVNAAKIAATRPAPSFLFCFGSLMALGLYYMNLVGQFYKMISHQFDADGNLKKEKKLKT